MQRCFVYGAEQVSERAFALIMREQFDADINKTLNATSPGPAEGRSLLASHIAHNTAPGVINLIPRSVMRARARATRYRECNFHSNYNSCVERATRATHRAVPLIFRTRIRRCAEIEFVRRTLAKSSYR